VSYPNFCRGQGGSGTWAGLFTVDRCVARASGPSDPAGRSTEPVLGELRCAVQRSGA